MSLLVRVCVVAAAVLAAACAAEPPPAEPEVPASTRAQLIIQEFTFPALTVTPGARVMVVNRDAEAHTVTADDGSFDTGLVGDDVGGFVAPTRAGTYPYHCTVHPTLSGTLVVE